MSEDVKNKGRFVKGRSGNPAGRPRNSKNKAMTDKQVMEYLGKRTEHYLKEIENLASETDNLQLKFKCYNGLVNFDFQLRASEYKKWLDKENLKIKKKQLDNKDVGSDNDQEDDHSAPVISLKAIEK